MRFEEVSDWFEYWSDKSNSTDPAFWEPEHVETLMKNSRKGDIPLYVSGGSFFMYGVAIATRELRGNFVDDILRWNFSIPKRQGWSCVWSASRGARGERSSPLAHSGSKKLACGTPLLFWRDLERGVPTY